ncbi:MAG: hypothetical protein ACO1TE_20330 [Prosthecobacter sp.]
MSTLSLETAATHLSEKDKAAFFDTFWKAWSANGFGTLGKKDTELLIFGCLKQAFGAAGPTTNHDWAALLRLTPAKLKSMRLEAHLRFGHLFGENGTDAAKAFLKSFAQFQTIDLTGMESSGEVGQVTVSFVIEDPVVQMNVENRLKSIGSYLDFKRNREVVTLRLTDFFKLLAKDVEQSVIDRWVAEKAKEKADAGSLSKRVKAREYADRTEMGKLKAFSDDLAKFGKVESLTSHLKLIFASQSERGK